MTEPAAARDPAHVPVMAEQVLQLLEPRPGQIMLDCTLGPGGHARWILPRLAPGGRYIGLDRDPAQLEAARRNLPDPPVRLERVHRSFAEARQVLDELGIDAVDLLLADLGFASSQVGDPQRGFSFRHDGPLDMRFDPTEPTTAADLLARLPERELADLIRRYGEERHARRIARKIVAERALAPMTGTAALAALCARAYGGNRVRIHPATRTFQALRMAVNDELGHLQRLLRQLPFLVRPGGRLVVLTFHSLEDRPVKHRFRTLVQQGAARSLTKRPWTATAAERSVNPRARSAKCRALQLERPEARETDAKP